MRKKYTLVSFFVFAVVFIVGMGVSAFYDLQISDALVKLDAGEYFSKDGFAVFVEIFGEIPLYLFLCYAIAVIFWNAYYFGSKTVKYLVCTISILAIVFVGWYIPERIHEYFMELSGTEKENPILDFVVDCVVGLSIVLTCLFGVNFSGKSSLKRQLAFAIVILFVAGCSQFVAQGLKMVNKRVRYRAMNAQGDFSYYTPWYVVNGFPKSFKNLVDALGTGDAIKSFPSGHTTAAGITFSMFAVPYVFKRFNDRVGRVTFYIVPLIYTLLVAYGRIRMGAHYLSDVVFGGSLAFIFAYVAVFVVFKSRKIKQINKYCFDCDDMLEKC